MKAIVFGGSGFIGSYVIEELVSKGYEVLNFDTNPNDFSGKCKIQKGSMLDYPLTSNTIVEYAPDVVYNFAGISNMNQCQNQPLDTIRKNVLGNAFILQGIVDLIELRLPGRVVGICVPLPIIIPKFVFASSLYVYSREGGFYSSGKRSCEMFIRDYAKKFSFPYVILRYGTIYGPGSNDNNSIYKLIRNALDTKVISYYGTGDEVREYVHVKDVARCSVEILDGKFENSAVVIAGSHPTKASDMVAMLRDILGTDYGVEFRYEEPMGHYVITPYAFCPDIATKKNIGDGYDFAAGLLDTIESIYDKRKCKK